jgi:NAD(P)H-quinone oxidoreductase subunit 5
MQPFLPFLLAAIPLFPLLAGLIVRHLTPAAAGNLAVASARLAALLAGVAAMGFLTDGAHNARLTLPGGLGADAVSLRLDSVSTVMVLLVSCLGAVTLAFSRRYLAGDPAQSRFFSWMSLTLAAVLTLVLSSHLLLLLGAWVATSLFLHRLLLHYPERPGAVFSARKKFVVSRLGDFCLLLASLALFRIYGTWDLDTIFSAVAAGKTEGLPRVGFLLAACAVMKSAQFPFHSWLPDTMETPTPVSAFMHAGIINAGGFLIVRHAALFQHAPGALNLLAIVGALTAGFGAIVMLAQPSVKRALAYSTIAQMGFMILQCGLGAYGLALLHIVAHSLYKAHSFLTAGSTIGAVPRAAIPLKTSALTVGMLGGGLLVAAAATLIHTLAPTTAPPSWIFPVILALALAYGLARIGSTGIGGLAGTCRGFAVALAIALASLALHTAAGTLFAHLPTSSPPAGLLAAIALLFAALFLFQVLLWRAGHHPLGRKLYVHALNGFYLGTYANRLLGNLWPRHPVS